MSSRTKDVNPVSLKSIHCCTLVCTWPSKASLRPFHSLPFYFLFLFVCLFTFEPRSFRDLGSTTWDQTQATTVKTPSLPTGLPGKSPILASCELNSMNPSFWELCDSHSSSFSGHHGLMTGLYIVHACIRCPSLLQVAHWLDVHGGVSVTVRWRLIWGFPGGSVVKSLPVMQETQFWSLGQDDPLGGNGNPLQYSCLGKRMPGTEEPRGLQSVTQRLSMHTVFPGFRLQEPREGVWWPPLCARWRSLEPPCLNSYSYLPPLPTCSSCL